MHTFRQFMSHKFTYRQSLLIIGAAVIAGLASQEISQAAGLAGAPVTGIGVAAAIATLVPLLVVFYRRANT